MNHPEYRDGAYLFSPIGDDRPARFWPICAFAIGPIVVALSIHFFFR